MLALSGCKQKRTSDPAAAAILQAVGSVYMPLASQAWQAQAGVDSLCAVQGVSAFAASRTFSLIASGGLERTVLLWHPAAPRSLVGSLVGHEAAVTHLALDDRHSQVNTQLEKLARSAQG